MARAWKLLVAVITVTICLGISVAQPPTWKDTTFDPAVRRRYDWCEKMRMVSNKTLDIRHVMEGVKLSVSLPNPASYSPPGFINVDENGAVKAGQDAGFMAEILDEVAARAGFTVRHL